MGPIFDVVFFMHPLACLEYIFDDEALLSALKHVVFCILRVECFEIEWIVLVSIQAFSVSVMILLKKMLA